MLTSADLKQIKDYLLLTGKKDSQLEVLPYDSSATDNFFDYIAVVKANNNNKVTYNDLMSAMVDNFSESAQIDDEPTKDSTNLVKSGGVWNAITEKSIPDGSVDWNKLNKTVQEMIQTHGEFGIPVTNDLDQEIEGALVWQPPLARMNNLVKGHNSSINNINQSLRTLDERLDAVEGIAIIFEEGETIIGNEGSDIEVGGAKVPTGNAIAEWGNSKTDKVAGAVAGNLVSLSSNGNIVDSGKSPSDFISSEDLDEVKGKSTDDPQQITVWGAHKLADSKLGRMISGETDIIILSTENGGIKRSDKTLSDLVNVEDFEDFKNSFFDTTFSLTSAVLVGTATVTATIRLTYQGKAYNDYTVVMPEGWTASSSTGNTRTFTKSVTSTSATTVIVGSEVEATITANDCTITKTADNNTRSVHAIYYGDTNDANKQTITGLTAVNAARTDARTTYTTNITANGNYFIIAVPDGESIIMPSKYGIGADAQLFDNLVVIGTANNYKFFRSGAQQSGTRVYKLV